MTFSNFISIFPLLKRILEIHSGEPFDEFVKASSLFFVILAYAGMTGQETFYEFIAFSNAELF